MDTPTLLDSYLKQLCLPTFSQQYRRLADDATRTQASYCHVPPYTAQRSSAI